MRSKSNPARPYICRLSILILLWNLAAGTNMFFSRRRFLTADESPRIPRLGCGAISSFPADQSARESYRRQINVTGVDRQLTVVWNRTPDRATRVAGGSR